jgi:hypothetical protein
MQGCRIRRSAGVTRHAIERVHRHVEEIAAGVFDDQEFRRVSGHLHDLQSAVAPDTVILVHDRGAG